VQNIVRALPYQEHKLLQVRQLMTVKKACKKKTLAEFKVNQIPVAVRTIGVVYRGLINVIKMMFGSYAMR
jgi:hypothetical protein